MSQFPPPDPIKDDPLVDLRERARQEQFMQTLRAQVRAEEMASSKISDLVNRGLILLGIVFGTGLGILIDVALWGELLDVPGKIVVWILLAPPAFGLIIGGTIGSLLGRGFHSVKKWLTNRSL